MPVIIGKNSFNQWPIRIPDATPVEAGVMTPADKAKLDALSPGGGALCGVQAKITFDNSLVSPIPFTVEVINSFGGITYDSREDYGFGWLVYFLLPVTVPFVNRQVLISSIYYSPVSDPFEFGLTTTSNQGPDYEPYLGIILPTNANPSGSPTYFGFSAQLFVIP